MEFMFKKIFTKLVIIMAKALNDHPSKEEEIRWAFGTAVSKMAEFGELLGIEYNANQVVFRYKNAVNLVFDLRLY